MAFSKSSGRSESQTITQFEEDVIVRLVEQRGVIHFELLKPGETVTADLYCQQLDQVRNELLIKWPVFIN